MAKKGYNRSKSVRGLARQRVGTVPSSRVITPKTARKRPKHKKSPDEDEFAG